MVEGNRKSDGDNYDVDDKVAAIRVSVQWRSRPYHSPDRRTSSERGATEPFLGFRQGVQPVRHD